MILQFILVKKNNWSKQKIYSRLLIELQFRIGVNSIIWQVLMIAYFVCPKKMEFSVLTVSKNVFYSTQFPR